VTPLLGGLAVAFGLPIGSFLNVVIHRVPAGRSVVHPRSACPRCGAFIRPKDNVPVVSWLVLRGRCRDCGAPISARYPAVEALTALLFLGVVVRFTVPVDVPWAVPAYLYFVAVGVALAVVDAETRRLPNAIVLPSYPVLAALLAVASWGSGDWDALLRAAIGGLALYVLYLVLLVVRDGAMGYGDVKLAGLVGAALAWVGWGAFAVGSFGAFLLGGVVGLALMLAGSAGRRTRIPFGPWMILGAAVGLACGEPVWAWYLSFLH
jgi:leader peptidase (prepilin peptidase)/N-methyltransferase